MQKNSRNTIQLKPKSGEVHSQQSSGVQNMLEGYQVMNDLNMIKEEFRNLELQRNSSNDHQNLLGEIDKATIQNHQQFLFGPDS
jgi:t-SNARE complex subunit (syntaxin)